MSAESIEMSAWNDLEADAYVPEGGVIYVDSGPYQITIRNKGDETEVKVDRLNDDESLEHVYYLHDEAVKKFDSTD